jgi:hypothetical protein
VLGVEAGEADAGEAPVFGVCPKTGAAAVNNMTTKNRIEVWRLSEEHGFLPDCRPTALFRLNIGFILFRFWSLVGLFGHQQVGHAFTAAA